MYTCVCIQVPDAAVPTGEGRHGRDAPHPSHRHIQPAEPAAAAAGLTAIRLLPPPLGRTLQRPAEDLSGQPCHRSDSPPNIHQEHVSLH